MFFPFHLRFYKNRSWIQLDFHDSKIVLSWNHRCHYTFCQTTHFRLLELHLRKKNEIYLSYLLWLIIFVYRKIFCYSKSRSWFCVVKLFYVVKMMQMSCIEKKNFGISKPITCSRHRNLQNIRIQTLQIFCYNFFTWSKVGPIALESNNLS